MQVTQEEYMRAVNSNTWKPAFLFRIDLEEALPYVSQLIFVPDTQEIMRINSVIKTFPPIRFLFQIKGGKSRIEVYENAFRTDVHENVGDFLSSLIDHEGFHAYEINKGSWKMVYGCEKRAMDNQIKNFPKRNISPTYREKFVEMYTRVNGLEPKIN
ncbi:MAG: hypothetical protein AABX03_01695 [Nanoarchaeota archaeon]